MGRFLYSQTVTNDKLEVSGVEDAMANPKMSADSMLNSVRCYGYFFTYFG